MGELKMLLEQWKEGESLKSSVFLCAVILPWGCVEVVG